MKGRVKRRYFTPFPSLSPLEDFLANAASSLTFQRALAVSIRSMVMPIAKIRRELGSREIEVRREKWYSRYEIEDTLPYFLICSK